MATGTKMVTEKEIEGEIETGTEKERGTEVGTGTEKGIGEGTETEMETDEDMTKVFRCLFDLHNYVLTCLHV